MRNSLNCFINLLKGGRTNARFLESGYPNNNNERHELNQNQTKKMIIAPSKKLSREGDCEIIV